MENLDKEMVEFYGKGKIEETLVGGNIVLEHFRDSWLLNDVDIHPSEYTFRVFSIDNGTSRSRSVG